MKKKYVIIAIWLLIISLILVAVVYILFLIQFSRQSTWEPPEYYSEETLVIQRDSVRNENKSLDMSDSSTVKMLHDYLKREQYGAAPLQNGDF
ncbi:MAG: hypothetical protein ACFHU9_04685 [Fluviicola sp.]